MSGLKRLFGVAAAVTACSVGLLMVPGRADENPAPAEKKSAPKQVPRRKAESANPIENFFENLFNRPSRPEGLMQPIPGEDGSAAWTYRDGVDRRVAFEVRLAAHVERARLAADAQDWDAVLEELVPLLKQDVPWPLLQEHGPAASTQGAALMLLARVPRSKLGEYVREHSAIAQQELDDALQSPDPVHLADVAARHFRTPAGDEAANRLASWHLDRGHAALASWWFDLLLRSDPSRSQNDAWVRKARLAFRMAGRTEFDQRLSRLRDPASTGDNSPGDGGAAQPLQSVEGQAGSRGYDSWRQLHGTPSGIARAQGSDPLLLKRWSHPVAFSDPLMDELRFIADDLEHDGKALIPATVPLAVDGKAVWRTLRGLQVFDIATGRLVWESTETFPPETLLMGAVPEDGETRRRLTLLAAQSGEPSQFSPLADLIFRDQARGALSSDGEYVFAVEETAHLSAVPSSNIWINEREEQDDLRRDHGSNRLTAYRLDSGRKRWSIGGPLVDENFGVKMAGVYFLGPPTPWRGTLYVLGEIDQEIRLYALDPAHGTELWSILLGYPEAEIAADRVRRRWLAQPAIANGVVVCPGTIDWLFAVDPVSRTVLWAQRFSPREVRRGRSRQTTNRPLELNVRWSNSGPFVTRDSVLYAPWETPGQSRSEAAPLVCYDLLTGTERWQRRKYTAIYVAGVFDDRAVIVGTDQIVAVSMQSGKELWTLKLASGDTGLPCGRGVATSEHYYVPFSSGKVWKLGLGDGRVVAEMGPPTADVRLGNLVMHAGAVLSAGPCELVAFEQRDAIQPLIAQRLAADPRDPWALLRTAEMALLQDETSAALDALARIDPAGLATDQAHEFQEVRFRALVTAVTADLSGAEQEWEQLQAVSRTQEQRLRSALLAVRRYEARGELLQAFDACRRLAVDFPDQLVTPAGASDVFQNATDWVGNTLARLWNDLDEASRAQVDSRIRAAAEELTPGDHAAVERFCKLFRFHPIAESLLVALADEYARTEEFLAAERHLIALAEQGGPTAPAERERLKSLFETHGVESDFSLLLAGTVADHESLSAPAGPVDDETSPATDETAADDAPSIPSSRSTVSWNEYDLAIVRMAAGNYSSMRSHPDTISPANGLPYYDYHRLRYHRPARNQHRLEVLRGTDDHLERTIPLRELDDAAVQHPEGIHGNAHQLVVLHGDIVHCVSLIDGRVLWTRPLAGRRSDQRRYYSYRAQSSVPPLQQASGLINRSGLIRTAQRDESRIAATLNYVACRERRELTLLDAATGRVRWSRRGVPDDLTLLAARDYLFLGNRQGDETLALRVADGSQVEVHQLSKLLDATIHVSGNHLTIVDAGSSASGLLSLFQSKVGIRQVDPLTGVAAWTRTFDKQTQFSLVEDDTLFFLESEGTIGTLDLITGERANLNTLTADEMDRASAYNVLPDADRLYVAINRGRAGSRFSSTFLPSVDVDGELIVFDRRTGRRLWSQNVKRQSLVVQDFRHLPVVLFATASAETIGTVRYRSLQLTAFDKHTGRQMLDAKTPANSDFQSLELDLAARAIELRTYNDSLRLVTTERQPPPAPQP